MIWVNWWISRSSFSRSIMCPPSRRSDPLICGDHMHLSIPAAAHNGTPPRPAKAACKSGRFMGTDKERRALGQSWSASHSEQPHWRALIGANMDITTLLIIVVVVLLLGGGGWYGRGRWY